MAMSQNLKKYLDKENVSYEAIEHKVDYTAQEIAGSLHVPGKQMVKSVIVKVNGEFIMCVLPSIHLIDFEKLKNITNSKDVQLAEENEIAKLFPDYEIGTEPPFGQLYGLKVYADKILQEDDEIVFNAGTHTDVVRMKLNDYMRLTNPIVADIGTHI